MAETKPKVETKDPWQTPKETWQYVTVPDEDPLGHAHPTVSLNKHVFEPGKTYLLPPQVAEYVTDRVRVYARSCVRQLQPNVDLKSLREVAVGTANSTASQYTSGAQLVDGSTLP